MNLGPGHRSDSGESDDTYIHGTVDLLKRGCIFMPMYMTATRRFDYKRAGVLVNEWRLWTWKMNLKRQQLESR